MSIDVSVYRVRTRTGYYNTVAGGSATPVGASPYANSLVGGAGEGVVNIYDDQRISGQKFYDSSAFFILDVSIGGDLFVHGSAVVDGDYDILGEYKVYGNATFVQDVSIDGSLYINGQDLWKYEEVQDTSIATLLSQNIAQDTSISWLNTNKLGIDTSISSLSDVSLGGIGSAQDGSALVYDASLLVWTYGVAGGLEDVSLGGLIDVISNEPSVGSMLIWTGTYWEAIDVSVTPLISQGQLVRDTSVWNCSIGTTWSIINQIPETDISTNFILDGSNGTLTPLYSGFYLITAKATILNSSGGLVYISIYDGANIIPGTESYSEQDGASRTVTLNSGIIKYLYADTSLGLYTKSGSGTITQISNVIFNAYKLDNFGVTGGGVGACALEDLTNVYVSGLSNYDFLQYKSATAKWENVAPVDLLEFGSKASNAYGVRGDMAFDASYFYICTDASVWIRILGEGGY